MVLERRGQVIAVEPGPTGYAGRSPIVQRKAVVATITRMLLEGGARITVLGGITISLPGMTTYHRQPTGECVRE